MGENETNPYEEAVSIGAITREDADAKWAKEKEVPADNVEPVTKVEEIASSDKTEQAETNTPAAAAEPFYKSLGFENEDSVLTEINEAKTLRERIASMQAKEAELAEKEAFISKFENPYSHDLVGKLDKAIEKTGISDLNILGKLVSATPESVAGDPVTAIVIAKILDNPNIIGDGVSFDDLMAIETNKLERAGVDLDDKTSIEYKSLVVDSKSALTKINNFQQDLGNVQGKYNFAKENSQKATEKFNQDVAFVTPKVEELLKSDKRNFEVEGVKFDVALSKEQREKVKENASRHAAQLGLNLNTVEGVKTLKELVDAYAKGAVVSSGDFEKELFKAVDAKVRAEVLDEVSQGKPDKRSSPSGAGSIKGKSDSQSYFDQLLSKAEGKI
jgi:hypothetical protein